MEENEIQTFTHTGLMHVLAVSGLHIGIFVMFFQFLVRLILPYWKQRSIRLIVLLTVITAYVLLTGASASVQRAGIMMAFYLIASETNVGNTNKWNVLFASMFVLLLINPLVVYSIGFQFSYIAVAGILAFYSPLNKYITVKNYVVRRALQLCLVSTLAQLATSPLALYYFGTFPTWFLLSNLLVVPLVFCLVSTGATFILLSEFNLVLDYVAFVLNAFLSLTRFVVAQLAQLPYGLLRFEVIELPTVLCIYSIMLVLSVLFLNPSLCEKQKHWLAQWALSKRRLNKHAADVWLQNK